MDPFERPLAPVTEVVAFATTHWSEVLAAGDSGCGAEGALTKLCATYWPPLHAFLRRQGCSPHDAEDLVQGFFERFLARDYLQDVDRTRGRFRSFLLASLRHYSANQRRGQRALRRGGASPHLAWEEGNRAGEESVQSPSEPELVYDRVWAQTVMESALGKLRAEHVSSGRAVFYDIIRVWLAREALPGEYGPVAARLGLTPGALAVAVHRLRQRFRQLVREEVAHTVRNPADVDDEMRHLLRVWTAS